jgi:hypothetical protein
MLVLDYEEYNPEAIWKRERERLQKLDNYLLSNLL